MRSNDRIFKTHQRGKKRFKSRALLAIRGFNANFLALPMWENTL